MTIAGSGDRSNPGRRTVRLADAVDIVGKSVSPEKMKSVEVALYSLPAYDGGKGPECVSPQMIGSAKHRILGPCVLLSKLNPHIPRIWVVRSAEPNAYCSPEFFQMAPARDDIDLDYMAVVLRAGMARLAESARGSTRSHSRLTRAEVLDVPIPIRSLEEQHKVVRIDRELMLSTMELQAALHRELEARRQQIGFYRDALFAFGGDKVIRRLLGEVGAIERGRRFTKSDLRDEGLDALHFGELYTRYDTFTHEAVSKVDSDLHASLRFAAPGDLIIAGVSETVEDIGKAIAWLGDGPVAVHDDCFFFHHELNPKFVAYYFQTRAFHVEKTRHVASGKIKRLSANALASISIPVPSRDRQDAIVETLDQMHALVNDLGSGLPAEIAARREQYEYYRDRLLAFEPA